ncbi:MAG: aldehyde dehydrogenase family protein [Desulfobacteraceae bacterium]|jgi:aldehyde dehydrogenase (NAD+)
MQEFIKYLNLAGEQSGAGGGPAYMAKGPILKSISPSTGSLLGIIHCAAEKDYEMVISKSVEAFSYWRKVPAPKRGEIVRQIGEAFREAKEMLGMLITFEVGKIKAEGLGEVQEAIDIADFCVGQSRMLYGLSMHSERSGHRMFEQWHPLGPVGVITAFNFPIAVWAWNTMVALVAGNTVIWKPSSKAPLTALAVTKIVWQVLKKNNLPEGIVSLIVGGRKEVGEALINDPRIPLISATGSVTMGQHVGQTVAKRFGRTILELGGNNAVVVTPAADLSMAVKAIVFGAVGTAGQRCTTTRRVIVHTKVYDQLLEALISAYKQVRVGDPMEPDTLMGPLIDINAVGAMQVALKRLEREGGRILYGGSVLKGGNFDVGTYVTPCICEAPPNSELVCEETFAPILYLTKYQKFEEAIKIHNNVPQGLSSAIFTNDLRESEQFLSAMGSDCGIANVNVGTSGAEIGGAFGGEKETGGGRESGSDAWKAYMRRQTCTINWSSAMPLAQGIKFEVSS